MTTAKAPALKIPTVDEMRQRFQELSDEIASIESKSVPLREERDAIIAEADKKTQALEKKYLKIEEGLDEKKNELGNLVRLLKGQTGIPEVVKAEEVTGEKAK